MPTPAWVSDVPGATTALQTVATKLKDFDTTGPKLLVMQHQAALLKGQLNAQGNTEGAAQAAAQLGRIQKLYRLYGSVSDKLAPVRGWLSDQGFGVVAIPIIIAVAAVAAVGAMTYIIAQAAIESRELDALANGSLTADQLIALRKEAAKKALVNFDFGSLVPWLVGGIALYFGGPFLLAAVKRKRRVPA